MEAAKINEYPYYNREQYENKERLEAAWNYELKRVAEHIVKKYFIVSRDDTSLYPGRVKLVMDLVQRHICSKNLKEHLELYQLDMKKRGNKIETGYWFEHGFHYFPFDKIHTADIQWMLKIVHCAYQKKDYRYRVKKISTYDYYDIMSVGCLVVKALYSQPAASLKLREVYDRTKNWMIL